MKQLETKRLILRKFEEKDLYDLYEYAKKEEIGPMAGWKPHESIEETRRILEMFMKEQEYAIVLKEINKVIGSVGVHKDRYESGVLSREIGYVLDSRFWGKEITLEAVNRVLEYLFEEEALELVRVSHYTFNLRSKRVIEKLGFVYNGTIKNALVRYDGMKVDSSLYSMTKQEYENRTNSSDTEFSLLAEKMYSLLEGCPNVVAKLSNASALLNEEIERLNWVGFYLREDNQLILGPFQGKVACTRIPLGKGVCGTSALKNETILVEDVHKFPGHIACDSASNSEIVIPLHNSRKEVVAVLDIDSPYIRRFKESDKIGLERIGKIIEESCF